MAEKKIQLTKISKKKEINQKITVYLNDLAVEVLDWMEIRHALYKPNVPFGYRDGVIAGELLICDSEGFIKELSAPLKANAHYYLFPASEAEFMEDSD